MACGSTVRSRTARRASDGLADSGPTAAILLHGVAGNFYTSSTFEPLIPKLQELGLAVLCVNTRGHDSVFGASLGNVRRRFGAAYEIVDDCRHDIAAWIEFLKSRGHRADRADRPQPRRDQSRLCPGAREVRRRSPPSSPFPPPRLSYSAFMNAPESSLFLESMQHGRARWSRRAAATSCSRASFRFRS